MDFSIMDSCQIANLRPIFGRGFRGETLAAARNRKWMDVLIRAGVNTIIDLRTADHNDKLAQGWLLKYGESGLVKSIVRMTVAEMVK